MLGPVPQQLPAHRWLRSPGLFGWPAHTRRMDVWKAGQHAMPTGSKQQRPGKSSIVMRCPNLHRCSTSKQLHASMLHRWEQAHLRRHA